MKRGERKWPRVSRFGGDAGFLALPWPGPRPALFLPFFLTIIVIFPTLGRTLLSFSLTRSFLHTPLPRPRLSRIIVLGDLHDDFRHSLLVGSFLYKPLIPSFVRSGSPLFSLIHSYSSNQPSRNLKHNHQRHLTLSPLILILQPFAISPFYSYFAWKIPDYSPLNISYRRLPSNPRNGLQGNRRPRQPVLHVLLPRGRLWHARLLRRQQELPPVPVGLDGVTCRASDVVSLIAILIFDLSPFFTSRPASLLICLVAPASNRPRQPDDQDSAFSSFIVECPNRELTLPKVTQVPQSPAKPAHIPCIIVAAAWG